MSMVAVQLTVPCSRVEWGELQLVGDSLCQTGTCYQADGSVACVLSVMWPPAKPASPVLCQSLGRHAGPQD